MVTYNDKILVPNTTKDGLDTIHPETNTGNVYDFINNGWLSDTFSKHTNESVASENGAHKLRYFNGELAYKGDSDWEKIKTVDEVQDFPTGNVNDLTETGLFSTTSPTIERGFPRTIGLTALIKVYHNADSSLVQELTFINGASSFKYFRTKASTSWSGWVSIPSGLSNDLDSTSTEYAATANVVKMVNDNKANRQQENWVVSVLEDGWTQFESQKLRYFKDEFNAIHLYGGTLKSNPFQLSQITTLPVGYRPIARIDVPITHNNGITYAMIYPDGRVQLGSALSGSVLLYFNIIFSLN